MKLGGTTSIAVVALFAGTMVGCGGGSKPATPVCAVNSDCAKYQPAGLVCALGYCVSPCHVSSDCPVGERCVIVGGAGLDGGAAPDGGAPDGGAKEQGTACQAPEATSCHYNSQCQSPLVCASDSQCRNQCQTTVDCPGGLQSPPSEVCTVVSHLCVDPTIDKDYNPNTMELTTTTDAGTTGAAGGTGKAGASGQGGAGAAGGSAGSGAAGATAGTSGGKAGAGGAGGSGGTACAGPQIQFANVSQGDTNAFFDSAAAVRNADTLFVFTGYNGPPPVDGGVDSGVVAGNAIFVQTFDPMTGAKRGPAQFLFSVGAGGNFYLNEASIAPTGEIALLYQLGATANVTPTQLFATFLTVASGDGGAGDLQVKKTIQLESVQLGDPHVVWESASQLFVFSWKYQGGSWYTRIRKYHTDGTASGTAINAVPIESTTFYPPSEEDDGYVGTSGLYLGVGVRYYGRGSGAVTILDSDGFQVGPFVEIGTVGTWIGAGGTPDGFVTLTETGTAVNGTFISLTGSTSVIADAGTSDAGLPPLKTFTFTSTASTGKLISDDTGGANGLGAALLEAGGASFVYVTEDASKQYAEGTVIISSDGAQVGISQFGGSFVVSLFNGTGHNVQATVSSCQ